MNIVKKWILVCVALLYICVVHRPWSISIYIYIYICSCSSLSMRWKFNAQLIQSRHCIKSWRADGVTLPMMRQRLVRPCIQSGGSYLWLNRLDLKQICASLRKDMQCVRKCLTIGRLFLVHHRDISITLSLYLSIYLSIHQSITLSIELSFYLSLSLSLYIYILI